MFSSYFMLKYQERLLFGGFYHRPIANIDGKVQENQFNANNDFISD